MPSVMLDGDWSLVFEDDFDDVEAMEANWEFQNGPSGHILSSRWRENAALADGRLRLTARKEQRAGQAWTAASLWTKRRFQYGYFECRYRFAGATGTNNSFWLMTRERAEAIEEAEATGRPADLAALPQQFEIDVCEGHYPNEAHSGYHNWTGEHWKKGDTRWDYAAHGGAGEPNLAESFHVYSLLWTPEELVYYFDGREFLRLNHTICNGEAAVFLSLAIIKWAGPVTDAIDGASMVVDYVRVWQKAPADRGRG